MLRSSTAISGSGLRLPMVIFATTAQLMLINSIARASRCPDFAEYADTDTSGDCECPTGTACRKRGEGFDLGCEFSGGSAGTTYFYPCTPLECECVSIDNSCPASAAPGGRSPNDDCRCNLNSLCYQEGNTNAGCVSNVKIAQRAAGQFVDLNDTIYFKGDCKTCFCQPLEYARSVANPTSTVENCNAEVLECIASDSNFVAAQCDGSEWERCCDHDGNGCSRKCCKILPGWLIALICAVALVVIACVTASCCWYHHRESKRRALIQPEWADEVKPKRVSEAAQIVNGETLPPSDSILANDPNVVDPQLQGVGTDGQRQLPPIRGPQPPSRPQSAASRRFEGIL